MQTSKANMLSRLLFAVTVPLLAQALENGVGKLPGEYLKSLLDCELMRNMPLQ